MKWILSILVLTVAFQATAADKKIGNLVLVERTIENVFSSCITQIEKEDGPNPPGQYFACTLPTLKNSLESTPPAQVLLRHRTADCTVDADVINAKVFIMLSGAQANATFATAKSCLTEALNTSATKNSLKFLVFTVE